MTATPAQTRTVPDAPPGNWVDRLAPAAWQPYLRLMRFDRPIGAWLLLFPCWWGQALAELSLGRAYPSPFLIGLFLAGAFIMRGAGCTYNDIVDRDYDASVARTAARPIPSGQVSVAQAWVFLILLCLAGLAILVQLNAFTIVLGASSLLLIAVYPFAKRFTYWPQVVLGLTFKWGALVGWAAVTGSLSLAPVVLYAGCVLWTIGYDTIYAHQDKDDDAAVGLKSTALRFGAATQRWLVGILCRRRLAVGDGWRSRRRGDRVLDRVGTCCASARLAGGDARHCGYAQLPCPLQVQSARGLGTVPGACGRHGPRRARFRPLRRQSAQRLRRGRRSERAAIPACRCIAARPRPSSANS